MMIVKRLVLPLVIILAGFGLASVIVATGPKLSPKPPAVRMPTVRVVPVIPGPVTMTTSTHGTVLPRTESELVPEVSGRVLAISPALVSGGFFRRDEVLINIDPIDFEVNMEQARANLVRATSELANAKRAHSRQIDLASKQSTSDAQMDEAANRLKFAEATEREALARLALAERDLQRTEIRAPYDGRVRTERVDRGQFVSRGAQVATIYATDFIEVRLPVHDEELAFLNLPLGNGVVEGKPRVVLKARFAGALHHWEGRVVRTEGELDPATRMIHLVAQVADPYRVEGDRPPLAVGLFVEAEVMGASFEDIVVLPRSALRQNNQVYLVDTNGRIRFRQVDILRIMENEVYVRAGLTAGERVCVSPLDLVMEGMPVLIAETRGVTAQ